MIGFLALFLNTDNTSFEPDSPDFPLYKNSRFKECSAIAPDVAKCNIIDTWWTRNPRQVYNETQARRLIMSSEFSENGTHLNWCEMVSCLNGFKVIPTSARESAIGPTNFNYSWVSALTCLNVMWTFKKWNPALNRRDRAKPCRGLRELNIIDWLFTAWDICGPIIWWWISFFLLLAKPVYSTTLSILAWTTSLKTVVILHYHPYSCALARSLKVKKALSWVFGILAVVQWAASVYIMQASWGNYSARTAPAYQGYNCLRARMPDAPGTSPCSAEQLCSDSFLFRAADFSFPNDDNGQITILMFFVFYSLPLSTLLVVVALGFFEAKGKGDWREWRQSAKQFTKYMPTIPFSGIVLVSVLALLIGSGRFCYALVLTWKRTNRDAVLAFDKDCHAVHVSLSPWKYYMDINKYSRALRVAKTWFGA